MSFFAESNNGVHVIGHNDISEAIALLLCQLRSKDINNDPFGTIIIKQTPSLIAGEGYKMEMSLEIPDDPVSHARIVGKQ